MYWYRHDKPFRYTTATRQSFGALLLGLLLALLLVACGSGEPLSDDEIRQQVGSYLEKEAQNDRFSGTVLVAKDGVPIVAQAYGMANRETQTANTTETVYGLASVPKMFTAVAIGQLLEQGKLRLDDPISAYLPDYPAAVANKVSIKHLLSHTSGVPDFFFADPEKHEVIRNSRNPQRDIIPVFASEPLNFEPGTKYEYSNSNFLLLGAIIEHVSGQNYYDYVREHIFEPAGMDETFWAAEDVQAERFALGYTNVGSDGRETSGERTVVDSNWIGPEGTNSIPLIGGAYGGGYATAGDLLRFLTALRKGTLLSEQVTEVLFTGLTGDQVPNKAYAYGFEIRRAHGLRAVGHTGGGPGFYSEVFMYPEGYDLIILSNYDNSISDATIARLNRSLMR